MFSVISLVLINIAWAASYTVVKIGLADLDPVTLVFLRVSIAGVILLLYSLLSGSFLKIDIPSLYRIILSAILISASQLLWSHGVDIGQASDASLLFSTEPVWGIVLAALFLKERLNYFTFASLVVAVIGLAILSRFNFINFIHQDNKMLFANLLIIMGTICEVLFTFVMRPLAKKIPPEFTVALIFIISGIILLPFGVEKVSFGQILSPSVLYPILFLSIICSSLGYTLWIRAIKKIPVNLMYFTLFLQPIFGPIFAKIFLSEIIDEKIIVGGSMILLSLMLIVISQISKKIKPSEL